MKTQQFINHLNLAHHEQLSSTAKGFDLVICVGIMPSRHDQTLLADMKDSKVVYLFTMEDQALMGQTAFFSRYEVGSEEGIFALLTKSFLANTPMPQTLRDYFEALDEGYLSAESNLGEEEIEEIEALYDEAKSVLIVLGNDLIVHPQADNIARFAGIIANHAQKTKLFVSGASSPSIQDKTTSSVLDDVEDLKSFDGVVVYQCPAVKDDENDLLFGSAQFQMAAKVQPNETVNVIINQEAHPRTFVRDDRLKGVIALMPVAQAETSYPYHVVKIVK